MDRLNSDDVQLKILSEVDITEEVFCLVKPAGRGAIDRIVKQEVEDRLLGETWRYVLTVSGHKRVFFDYLQARIFIDGYLQGYADGKRGER